MLCFFDLDSWKCWFNAGYCNIIKIYGKYHQSSTSTTLNVVGRQLTRTRSHELKLHRCAQIPRNILTCLGPQNCNSSLVSSQVLECLCFSRHALFLFSQCVCGQKPWESFVIIPEMQSVLFSLEALFFVLITDIRQLQPFLKLLQENEPWHLILRTSISVTEWSVMIEPGWIWGSGLNSVFPPPPSLGCITQ